MNERLDLSTLKSFLDGLPPGPWLIEETDPTWQREGAVSCGPIKSCDSCAIMPREVAQFVQQARDAMPLLIDELERWRSGELP